METTGIALPKDLLQPMAAADTVFTHDYRSTSSAEKSKVQLTQNILSFLLDGTKELIHAGTSTKIQNDHFLLIRSGNCLMTEHTSSTNQYRSLLLFFDDSHLLRALEKYPVKKDFPRETLPFMAFEYDPYIRHFVQSVLELDRMQPAMKQVLLHTKCEEILLYLIQRNGPESMLSFFGTTGEQEARFKTVVENNVQNHLSIEELAFLCNMSVSTFKRAFQKQYAASPIKWFQEKRLEHAAFLIEHKNHRPSDLYLETGYESLSSFIQAFKKKFGTTPKQFGGEKLNF